MAIGGIGGNADFYTNRQMYNQAAAGPLSPEDIAKLSANDLKKMKKMGRVECETCASRSYVDGSDDAGVSFKTPTKVDPSQAASKVYSHEREHYNRDGVKAEREGREVVSQNIRVFTSICPECGRSYVSGGETTTVTKGKAEREPANNKPEGMKTVDMLL